MDWTQDLVALAQVVMIDVALAGDNAVVVGLAVAGLPARQKRPAIIVGIAAATILRILLGTVTLQLLQIVGVLEDVPRIAAPTCRRAGGRAKQDADAGDDSDRAGRRVHEPGQRARGG